MLNSVCGVALIRSPISILLTENGAIVPDEGDATTIHRSALVAIRDTLINRHAQVAIRVSVLISAS